MIVPNFGLGHEASKKPSAKPSTSYRQARTNRWRQQAGRRSLPWLGSAVCAPPVSQLDALLTTEPPAKKRPHHEISCFSHVRRSGDQPCIHQQFGRHTNHCGWSFCLQAYHDVNRQRSRSTWRSHRRDNHRFHMQGDYCDHSRHADLFGACSVSAARAVVLVMRSTSQLLFAHPVPIWHHLREHFTCDCYTAANLSLCEATHCPRTPLNSLLKYLGASSKTYCSATTPR